MGQRVVEVAVDRYVGWRERFEANNADGPQRVVRVGDPLPVPLVVLLIRRGGYAVGVVTDAGLVAHKVGSRRVQSRTAAGGWSQQRFARRRANQADALVAAVQDHLARLRAQAAVTPLAVVRGGDRALVAEVLEDARLRDLADLPSRDYPGLPDPRRTVLDDIVARATAYQVTIDDGPTESAPASPPSGPTGVS
jgi:hypothetical protein